VSTDIPAGYHRDESGTLWPDDCTCGGKIGARCPVCNPAPDIDPQWIETAADAVIASVIWGDDTQRPELRDIARDIAQGVLAATVELIAERAAADARADERERIAVAIEREKPSAGRFWDAADAATAYALTRAAAVARRGES
jgi:hypothetical protein